MKYLNRIEQKRQPIAKRKNLLTGEPLPTPIYANEPAWKEVSQKLSYNLSAEEVSIIQNDTLYAGNKEKLVRFHIRVVRAANVNATFWSWYREETRNYIYSLPTLAERGDDGKIYMTGRPAPEDNSGWRRLSFYDERRLIFYSLFICMDREGKIAIRNSEEGSFRFFASACLRGITWLNYPRDYYADLNSRFQPSYTEKFELGRYDLNGKMIPMESFWKKAERDGDKAKGLRPTGEQKDPLNIFAERRQ
ncbi:MAG: hypothetical protein LUE08_06785 [Akkermansiaceae bacterium]|nr:hypothetical protein [Akkermansiaceae bacterium]